MSCVSPVVLCGRTDGQTQTDRQRGGRAGRQAGITELIVGFCNFAKASKNSYVRQNELFKTR